MAKRARIPIHFVPDHNDPDGTVVKIVLAYDDFETGKHATEICGQLLRLLGRTCAFRNSSWKFDLLGHPRMQQLATEEAATASLIIIAPPDGQELPREVKDWIKSWLLSKRSPRGALLTLLCPPSEQHTLPPDYSFLENAARQAHVDFFYSEDLLPKRD